nr:Myb family protein-like protein [Ipomoea trifida]
MKRSFKDLSNDPNQENPNIQNNPNSYPQHPQNIPNPYPQHPQNYQNPYPQHPQTFPFFHLYPPNYSNLSQYPPNYPYFPQGPMYGISPVNGPSIGQGAQILPNLSCSHTPSTNVGNTFEEDANEVHTHPMGQMALKQKGKEHSTSDDDETKPNVLPKQEPHNKHIDKMQKDLEERSMLLKEYDIKMANNILNDIEERSISIKEYEIMMRDTSTMTKEQLSVHQAYCEITKTRWYKNP